MEELEVCKECPILTLKPKYDGGKISREQYLRSVFDIILLRDDFEGK